MKPQSIRLFIKPGCPWCEEVMEWFDSREIKYQLLDVIANAEARKEMIALTGQSKAPCMDADGQILADFGADELAEFWEDQGYSN